MFRRILVAIDASPHSRAALNTAVRVAADFEAELEGLFIKDENLLRAAQLPFAAEVRTHSVSPKRLTDRRVERQLRYQAERAEAALQDAAERADVSYEFRVVEGQVTRELLRAAQEADLVALGKTSTRSSRRRLGTTSEAVLSEAPAPVLVLRKAVQGRQPILTYYDGSDVAAAALHIAAELATRGDGHLLTVLIPTTTDANAEQLHGEVLREYGHRVPQLEVSPLSQLELDRIAARAGRIGHGLCVMPAESSPLDDVALKRFLYEVDRPLLLVRDEPRESS